MFTQAQDVCLCYFIIHVFPPAAVRTFVSDVLSHRASAVDAEHHVTATDVPDE